MVQSLKFHETTFFFDSNSFLYQNQNPVNHDPLETFVCFPEFKTKSLQITPQKKSR